jgi:hypothetical protein
MKTIYYISLILLIAFSSSSCKTKKEVVNTSPPPKSSFETVNLGNNKILEEEKRLMQDEIDEISEFAKQMAEAYCNIKSLKARLETHNDEGTIRRLSDQQKLLEEMTITSEKKYSGRLTKPEFEKFYSQYKKECE